VPRDPGFLAGILGAVEATPYGALLRDPHRRHQLIFRALAASDDSLTREVGNQLLAGLVTPRQLLRSPEYRQFFTDSLAAAQRFDVRAIRADTESSGGLERLTGDLNHDLLGDAAIRRRQGDQHDPDGRP
jgi:hypothetical protein